MDLLASLEELGIERLREGRKEISGCCPAHKRITGHADSHPSWSISKETGAHICYSCGWKGGLETLFQEVRGSVPEDLLHELQVTSITRAVEQYHAEPEPEVEPDWDWEYEKSVSVSVPEKLREFRHLKAAALDYYEVMWNRERACWMLPCTMPDGRVYGAQYRVHGSEHNIPTDMEIKDSLFGIDKVVHEGNLITLVESPLDAVRLWQVGVPAVASYGAWVSKEQVNLLLRHFNILVLAMDDDTAGRESTARLERTLGRRGVTYFKFRYRDSGFKDPGDFTNDEELYLRWRESFNLFQNSGPISTTLSNGRSSEATSSSP